MKVGALWIVIGRKGKSQEIWTWAQDTLPLSPALRIIERLLLSQVNAMTSIQEEDTRMIGEKAGTVIAKRPRIGPKSKNEGNMAAETEISRGAEGVVTRIVYLGRLAVRKKRLAKPYRHPTLDAKLSARRLSQEARILLRMRKAGIRVPALYVVDIRNRILVMEYLPGITLKAFLNQEKGEQRGQEIMREAGRAVAKMHLCDVVHGDLTTGNIMILPRSKSDEEGKREKEYSVCLIDFGLSSGGGTDEDLAVDLYVLERAVISAHSEAAEPLNETFILAYAKELNRPSVIRRLSEVRSRGRKRDMTG